MPEALLHYFCDYKKKQILEFKKKGFKVHSNINYNYLSFKMMIEVQLVTKCNTYDQAWQSILLR